MSESGYTLAEMLAALVIIGLAVGGLAESARTLRLTQAGAARAISQDQQLARARRGFARVLDRQGPFRSDDSAGLKGGETGFEFACRGGGHCSAQLMAGHGGMDLVLEGDNGWKQEVSLPKMRQPQFAFYTSRGESDVWPVTGVRQTLASVALKDALQQDPAPLMAARLWTEEAGGCAFDPIIEDCRTASP